VLYSEVSLLRNALRQHGISVPGSGLIGKDDYRSNEQAFSLSIQDPWSKKEHQRICIEKNAANNHADSQSNFSQRTSCTERDVTQS
jgi:hypothetical protein